MEVPHDIADDVRALHVRTAWAVAVRPHRVEDAAVHRFQPVAHVGKRARDDDRHRIVEEARAHLLLELARLDPAGAECSRLELAHTSRNFTFVAFSSMKMRRGSTASPISIENTSSARCASSTSTRTSSRFAGSIVVSHSWSAFISPRPLKRDT